MGTPRMATGLHSRRLHKERYDSLANPNRASPGGAVSPTFHRQPIPEASQLYNSTAFTIFFNNTSIMDALQSLPRDTAKVRNILFLLPMPFSLNTANYKLFWSLIDNVYSIRRTRDPTIRRPYQYRYVICRFKRARDTSPALTQSSQRASTTKRAAQSCDVCFVIHEYQDHVEFHHVPGAFFHHNHSLDESDANKRNSHLRGLVQSDIGKGYAPAAVIGAIRGQGRPDIRMRLEAVGGQYLSRRDAENSRITWRLANPNALFTTLADKDDVSIQALAAFEKLSELKWISEPIQAVSLDKTPGRGIVFALPARLERLSQYGHLSLIDSTHKTNQLEWKLFTVMVRDKFGSWHSIGHAFLSHEFGELIAEFLLVLKKWSNWKLLRVKR